MKTQKRISTKLLAVVLSVLMIVSIVPVGLFTAYASEPVTISVVDRENNGIAGVPVQIDTMVDETPVSIFTENVTTDSDGVADLSAVLEAYFTEHPGVSIAATATVSAEGYRQDGLLNVTITEDSTNLGTITLIKQYTLSVNSNNGEAAITIKDALENTYASGTSFDAGTPLSVTISNVENYNRTAKIGDSEIVLDNDNTYYLTLNENTVIDVTYTAVEYKVTVNYDAETGEVSPLEEEGGAKFVKVDKTGSGDIQLTLTPKEHYELKSILLNSNDVTDSATAGEGDVKYYTIVRDDIKADATLDINFGRKLYAVTYAADQENTGEIAVEGIEEGKVESETELTFAFTPAEGYALYKVEVNGKNQTGAVELKDNGAAELKVKVLNDTDVKAYFEKIDETALKDIASPGAVLNIEGYQYQGETASAQKAEIYYALKDQELTISANADALSAQNPAEGAKIYVYATVESQQQTESGSALVSDKRTENVETLALEKNNDALVSDITLRFMAKQQVEENVYIDVIKTLLIPGTVKLIYDNDGPDINIEGIDFSKYINTRVEGNTFTVTDADSGVKEVTLTRSYQETQDQIVSLTNEGNTYSFNVEPIDDYTGDITYVINTVDNNGNTSSDKFTVKNDTQAPELAEGQAIQFDVKNVNAFARALNKITFGKWFAPRMEVTLDVTDAGVKFLSDNAYDKQGIEDDNRPAAKIKLVNSDGSEYGVYSIKIEDGKPTTVEIVGDFEAKPFTGTVFYDIEDALGNDSGWQQCTTTNSNFGENATGTVMIENIAPTYSDEITPTAVVTEAAGRSAEGIPFDGDKYNEDVTFTFDIEDTNSGIYGYEVLVNGVSVADAIDVSADKLADTQNKAVSIKEETDGEIVKKLSFTIETAKGLTPKKDGSFVVEVKKITDNAGNEVQNVLSKTVYVDRTAPTITKFDFKLDKYIEGGEVPIEFTDNSYGYYFKKDVEVEITAVDPVVTNELRSGVKGIKVYLVGEYIDKENLQSATGAKIMYAFDANGTFVNEPLTQNHAEITKEALDKVPFYESGNTEGTFQKTVTVPANFKGQIFAIAVDNVNNDVTNAMNKNNVEKAKVNDYGYTHPDATAVESGEQHGVDNHITIKTKNIPSEAAEYNATTYDASESFATESPQNDSKIHLYNRDVTYTIKVEDTFSGIRKASYKIVAPFASGAQVDEGYCETDYSGKLKENSCHDGAGWVPTKEADSNLITTVTKKLTISHECNNIRLVVAVIDNAGNKSVQQVVLSIDKTAPEITLSAVPNKGTAHEHYYNTSRQFVVTVRERNINPNEEITFVKFNFSETSLAEKDKAELIRYKIGNFKTDKKVITATKENGEKYEYIEYKLVIDMDKNLIHTDNDRVFKEGHYTFSAQMTDLANHKSLPTAAQLKDIDYIFTLDYTAPIIRISYADTDQSSLNGKYYHNRTATITIIEHNFDEADLQSIITPSVGAVAPQRSAISHNGDEHTFTITYTQDGHYKYEIHFTDMAGNKKDTPDTTYTNWDEFYLDKVKPVIKIDGITNESVLKYGDDAKDDRAQISVTITDERQNVGGYVDFNDYDITLVRETVLFDKKDAKEEVAKGENVTDKFIQNAKATRDTVPGTITFTIPKGTAFDNNDGVYSLRVTAKDKTNNVAEPQERVFSVNRFGSVYAISSDLFHVLKDYTAEDVSYFSSKKIAEKTNLAVYEINPDTVSFKTDPAFTHEGDLVKPYNNYQEPENKIATGEAQVEKDSWKKYTYKFNPKDFSEEGEYRFFVETTNVVPDSSTKEKLVTNKNETSKFSKINSLVSKIVFNIDNTAPILTEHNGVFDKETYSAKNNQHEITFKLDDNNSFVNSFDIMVDSETIATWSNKNGAVKADDGYTLEQKDNGTFVLKIDSKVAELFKSKFTIQAKDIVDNEYSTDNEKESSLKYHVVTVSSNPFVLWAGNTVLFWSTIGGLAAVALAVFFIIFFRRLKKKEALEGETK